MSRFECPRCGAGIRPSDIQCGRCGEILRETSSTDGTRSSPPKITVENLISQEETSVRMGESEYVTVSRMRKLLERREDELNRREKELNQREKELLDSLEELEDDTQSLEKTMESLEREEISITEKERALRERETELDRISESLEEWRRVLGNYNQLMERNEVTPEDVERIIRIQENFQQVLDDERNRLREEVKEELTDEMENLTLKEEQFRVAESSLMQKAIELRNMLRGSRAQGEEKVEEEYQVLGDQMADTFKELDLQVGMGMEGPVSSGLIPTHVERLDEMLRGGVPQGNVILVNGTTGSMKSSLCYHILSNCATKQGIGGMYFSLEQSRKSLLRQMERLGLKWEESRDNLIVVDMVDLRKAMKGEDGDWRDILMRYVKNVKAAKDFELFVLDSLESFKAMTDFSFTREDLTDLFDWFREMGLTTFLISELPPQEAMGSSQGEMYLADGVIELITKEVGDRIQRWIRVPKLRGVNVDQRYYSIKHEGVTFQLHSPLTSTFV